MKDHNNDTTPAVGTVLHFLTSGLIFRTSETQFQADVSVRGQQIIVTEGLLQATADRNGRAPAWLRLADDPDAQEETFGRVIVGIGPAPANMTSWNPNSAREADDERARLTDAAFRLPEGPDRDAALRAMRRTVPAKMVNSVQYPDPAKRDDVLGYPERDAA